jgi:transposase InsO family protein
MRDGEHLSLEEMQAFLEATEGLSLKGQGRQEIYAWLAGLLLHHQYWSLGRKDKGLVKRYAAKVTGLSRAQITRLIQQRHERGELRERQYRRRRFPRRYTAEDTELLAAVDEAHETLSGPATRRILEREWVVYGKARFERLAGLSVGHLYNLRKSRVYAAKRLHYVKTKATTVAIGERRAPRPEGRPGYIRVDTVHQGDGPLGKGVYHINAVDEVTQWQVVSAVETICEEQTKPVLAAMLEQFPFRVLGFHSDNGSEYINKTVSKMLGNLLIEQTKSRPRRSNDNGLVESKNGAVVRKHIGYGYIEPEHAKGLNSFYRAHLNPYLNFHRPCAQVAKIPQENGRIARKYEQWRTPLEVLAAIKEVETHLREGVTLNDLLSQAGRESDTECATRMRKAKLALLDKIRPLRLSA